MSSDINLSLMSEDPEIPTQQLLQWRNHSGSPAEGWISTLEGHHSKKLKTSSSLPGSISLIRGVGGQV